MQIKQIENLILNLLKNQIKLIFGTHFELKFKKKIIAIFYHNLKHKSIKKIELINSKMEIIRFAQAHTILIFEQLFIVWLNTKLMCLPN